MTELKYRYDFDPHASNNTAASLARLVLTGGDDVLDIGSGPGWVSRYLAAEHGRRVTCVDNDPAALASLGEAGLQAVEADLESAEWYAGLAGGSWDVVVLADVLEHLRNPGDLLGSLLAEGLLRPDGLLVISVPNASHQSVVAELALGDMRYTETGILDRTHVRWFTRISLERLLEAAGFVVDRVERTTRPLRGTPSGERVRQLPPDLIRQLGELNDDSDVYQLVVRARPAGETARLVGLREDADAARREAHLLQLELTRARRLLVSERKQFEAETGRGVAELRAARKEAKELTRETATLRRQLETAQQRLERRGARLIEAERQRDRARARVRALTPGGTPADGGGEPPAVGRDDPPATRVTRRVAGRALRLVRSARTAVVRRS